MSLAYADQQLLGKEAACLYLGVSLSKLDSLVRDGKLAILKMGRSVKFEKSSLDRFKESCSFIHTN